MSKSLFKQVHAKKRNPLPNPSRRTILVVNPAPYGAPEAGPLSQARKQLKNLNTESHTMATAKQKAARAKFAAAARSGKFSKRRKRKGTRKRRNPSSRPRVQVSGSRKRGYSFTLGKKSPYKSRVKHTNPSRRKRRTFKRRNPSSRGGKKLLGFIDTGLVLSFVIGAAGFVGTVKFINPAVAKLSFLQANADGTLPIAAKLKGAAYIFLSLFGVAKIKNRMVRDALIGVGVAGAYDLIALNVPSAGLASLGGMDYSLVGYDPMGLDVSSMDLRNLNGVDTSLMGQDMSMIGSIY